MAIITDSAQDTRQFWAAVGKYLDYCQWRELGDLLDDPLLGMHPSTAEAARFYGLELYLLLGLLVGRPEEPVGGFALCRDWAISNGREFPWGCARDFLMEIARRRAANLPTMTDNKSMSDLDALWDAAIRPHKDSYSIRDAWENYWSHRETLPSLRG
jgi:hypothetical protein